MATQNLNLASLTAAQGISISGANIADGTGASVANVGDINGDGFPDIIVGAPGASPNSKTLAGICYVIFGNNSLSNIDLSNLSSDQGFLIYGANAHDGLSLSVFKIGDVNNDGYADIYLNTNNYVYYIVFGSNSSNNVDLANLSAAQGFYMSARQYDYHQLQAGNVDINNDNYADIVFSSRRDASPFAFVVFGGYALSNINFDSLSSTQGFSISGSISYDSAAPIIMSTGDVNKDGYDDMITCFSSASPISRSNAGKVYIIYGSDSHANINLNIFASTQGFSISGAISYDSLGYSVSIGDINGDGYDDIIIGAPDASPNSRTQAGKVYVIYGSSSPSNIDLLSLSSSQGFQILGSEYNSQIGLSVDGTVDINNDGYADIFINNKYVIYGNSSLSSIDLLSLSPSQGFVSLGGLYTKNIGDVNGDGMVDFLSGPNIVYGTKLPSNININSLSTDQGFTISGGSTYNSAEDINKDGYADIIVGNSAASPDEKSSAGEAWLIYGAASGFITSSPTVAPTPLRSTVRPTKASTLKPTLMPTLAPTAMPTQDQDIDITNGGTYNGTSANENFIINSSTDIIITGGGGNDMFTLKPHANVTITVTDFNKSSDKIDLKAFDIHYFNEVNITAGSIIITLEENQKMKLLQLSPGDIDANNFVFSPLSTPAPTAAPTLTPIYGSVLTTILLIVVPIVGVVAICAGGCIYARINHLWPFSQSIPEIVNENNHVIIEVVTDTIESADRKMPSAPPAPIEELKPEIPIAYAVVPNPDDSCIPFGQLCGYENTAYV